MQYKAIMLDVDGTLVPYDYAAIPSDIVADAIKKASKRVLVCLVTGRSYGFIDHILKQFDLDEGYAVVNNGAQVIDIRTKNLLYDQPLREEDTLTVIKYLHEHHIPFYLKENTFTEAVAGGYFSKEMPATPASMIFTDERLSEREVDQILTDFSGYPFLALNKGHHKHAGKFSINICHASATKLHGIEVILRKTGINKDAVIAAGDGYNDFPLLMAAGLKVAMGNAVPELKTIADIIAPTVEEDGVAQIIDEYILTD